MPSKRKDLRVFFCHASTDKHRVRPIYSRLKDDGFVPWFDEVDLLPGQDWRQEIRRAVQESDVVLVFISRHGTARDGFLQKEIRFALDVAEEKSPGTIFIIPARLEECQVPPHLSQWHWVDLFTDSGYPKLIRSLDARLTQQSIRMQPVSSPGPPSMQPFVSPVTHATSSISTGKVRSVSFMGDGTEFSEDIQEILRSMGVSVKATAGTDYPELDVDAIVLVRGERFTESPDIALYRKIADYVAGGGILFATPFVSWETHVYKEFHSILPFDHPNRQFLEDQELTVITCDETGLSHRFRFRASFEELVPRSGTNVFLATNWDLPLFGYVRHASGLSCYFNVCQHSCSAPMRSPLSQSAELRALMRYLFASLPDFRHNAIT